MPLVARGSTTAVAPTIAPTASAVTPAPVTPASGPLSVLQTGPQNLSQLTPIQAASGQNALKQGAGPFHFMAGPANELLSTLSQPVLTIGSLLNLDPANAARHLAQLPLGALNLVSANTAGHLLNEIPGFEHLTTPTSSVYPSQSRLLAPLINQLPTGLKQAVGFGTDVVLDPTTYLLPGAGAGLSAAEKGVLAGERALADTGVIAATAGREGSELLNPAFHAALKRSAEARVAERTARGRGAHLSVGLPIGRKSLELGTIPLSPTISRVAGKVGEKLPKVSPYFKTGGAVGKDPEYLAATQLGRTASTIEQGMVREMESNFARPLEDAIQGLNKAGSRAPDGTLWTQENAGRQIIHNYQQGPEHFPIPPELEPFRDAIVGRLDRLHGGETGAGLDVPYEPGYIPGRLKGTKDMRALDTWLARNNMSRSHYANDPFFFYNKTFKTHLQGESIRATEADVQAGLAKNVGDQLFHYETNLPKLMAARIKAHVNALTDHAVRTSMAERAGVIPHVPVRPDVAGAEERLAQAKAESAAVGAPRDVAALKEDLQVARGRRRFAAQAVAAARKTRNIGRVQAAQAVLDQAHADVNVAKMSLRQASGVIRGRQAGVRAALREPPRAAISRSERALGQAQAEGAALGTAAEDARAAAAEATRTAAEAQPPGATLAPRRGLFVTRQMEGGKTVRLGMRQKRARAAQPSVVPREAQPVARSATARRAMRQYFASEGPITQVEREAHDAAVKAERDALRHETGAVERARKRVVAANRSQDPVLIRQARQDLAAAQRAHIEQRIKLAVARERQATARGALGRELQAPDEASIQAAQKGEQAARRVEGRAEVALARQKGRPTGTIGQIGRAARKELRAEQALKRTVDYDDKVKATLERMDEQPGRQITSAEWQDIKKNYAKVGSSRMPDVHIPNEMRDVLERLKREVTRSLDSPQDRKPILAFARKVTAHWKALALLSPGHHFRNVYGDSISGWWAGARNPLSYAQSGRIITHLDDPAALERMKLRIPDGGPKNAKEFLREAEAMGIHGQGGAAQEFNFARDAKYADDQSRLKRYLGKLGKLRTPGTGKMAVLGQKVGQMREDATRLGTYLDLRKQGYSAVEAAERTHTWHYDYGHVSDFVDDARRFWAPFITYTAKSVPRTLTKAVTRPGYFSHHMELVNQLQSLAGVPGGPENLPVGQRSSFGIPDPGGFLHRILGMPADQPILWNPEGVSPWGTLNQLDPNQIRREPVSNLLNPFLKAGLELGTGTRFYYAGNAPQRSVAPSLIQALHAAGVPIPDFGPKMSQALGHTVPGYSSTLDEILQTLPVYGQQGRLSDVDDPQRMRTSIASFLLGLPVTSYDRARLAANAQKYGGK